MYRVMLNKVYHAEEGESALWLVLAVSSAHTRPYMAEECVSQFI